MLKFHSPLAPWWLIIPSRVSHRVQWRHCFPRYLVIRYNCSRYISHFSKWVVHSRKYRPSLLIFLHNLTQDLDSVIILEKKILRLILVYVHMCICVRVYQEWVPIGTRWEGRIPAAGVTGCHQLPDMSSGSRTQVLWSHKTQVLLAPEPSLQSLKENLLKWGKMSPSVKLLLAPSFLRCILNVSNKNVNKELAPSTRRSLGVRLLWFSLVWVCTIQ